MTNPGEAAAGAAGGLLPQNHAISAQLGASELGSGAGPPAPAAGRPWVWPALIAALSVAPYLGKLGNGLLNWDDRRFILRREAIRSLANVPSFFSENVDGLYRPLRSSLYALVYSLAGAHPAGWQLAGIALHLACCLGFYWMLRSGGFARAEAGVAGALFAAHPIHVERVAGVTASFDLLGEALLLAALALHFRAARDGAAGWRRFVWAPVLLAALFASEASLVFLPIVIAFALSHGVGPARWPHWRRAAADFGLAAVLEGIYLGCRLLAVHDLGRGVPRPAHGFVYNLLTVASGHVEYLKSFFLIGNLNYFHHVPVAAAGNVLPGAAALVVHLCLLAIAVVFVRRGSLGAFAIMWFYAALLPFSQILPIAGTFQERYGYLALGGWCMALSRGGAWGWRRAPGRAVRLALAAFAALLVAVSAAMTVQGVRAFHDDVALWSATVAKAPEHAGGWNNLGFAFLEKGECRQALPLLERAATLAPDFTAAARNLARCLVCLNRPAEAREAFRRYLTLAPDDLEEWDNLYRLDIALGRAGEAAAQIEQRRAAGGMPDPLLLTLALAQHAAGDNARAALTLDEYLARRPGDAKAQALRETLAGAK